MPKRKIHKKIEQHLQSMVAAGVAPGFQLCLGYKKETYGVFCAGHLEASVKSSRKQKVSSEIYFDLASLTKVIACVSLFVEARQKNVLSGFDLPLQTWFPFLRSGFANVSLRELLNHRSGLPALPEELCDVSAGRDEKKKFILSKIDEHYDNSFSANRGSCLYSDVGYLVLGFVLEAVFSKRLHDAFSDLMGEEAGVQYGPISFPWTRLSRFFSLPQVAPTYDYEDLSVRRKGEAQDPRARWLDGDAGHAGLFGTALAVENWGKEIFESYHGKSLRWSDGVVRELISLPKLGDERFVGGFDSAENVGNRVSQAGAFASATTIGHLGFTGTSFWMDIESGWRVTLLCHRHQPGYDASKLSEFRPKFHDWLLKEVLPVLQS